MIDAMLHSEREVWLKSGTFGTSKARSIRRICVKVRCCIHSVFSIAHNQVRANCMNPIFRLILEVHTPPSFRLYSTCCQGVICMKIEYLGSTVSS